MTEVPVHDPAFKQMLDQMVAARQLSALDAKHLASQPPGKAGGLVHTEESILTWLAHEYGLAYTTLDDI